VSQRLSEATLRLARPEAIRPAYDRAATSVGVVHFGPGAFHRAHQAFFFDRMLVRDPDLAISAVSLRSDAVCEALAPQDGLYSLVEREAEPSLRVIGAIKEVLTAPRDPEAVFARMTDPAVRLVSATVTEKGYCLTPGGDLDTGHPEIRRDLADPAAPQTLVGWLVEGLRRRRAAALPGVTALSCDNLSSNGETWRRTVLQFAQARGETELARWIEGEVRFPDSMVDSITPATDETLRAEAEHTLGLADAWPIQRERFVQWVVGGELGTDAATFAEAGVILTGDVAGFERAKLRLLNGAHSTLAYVGLRRGFATVAQAMGEPRLAAFVEALMRREIAPTVAAPAGLDLDGYVADVLRRFRNPAIVHKLSQIAWDGSQKLPVRLLATIEDALTQDLRIDRLATGVAAWMLFVRRQTESGETLVDPLSQELAAIAGACTGEPAADVGRFLALAQVFPRPLAQSPRLRAALEAAYANLSSPNVRAEFDA
jgi:fructuronate reductase